MRIKILFTAVAIGTFMAVTAFADSMDSIRAQAISDASQYYDEHKSDPGWDYNSIEVYNYSHHKAAERGFTTHGDDSVYASAFSEYLTHPSGKPVMHPSSTPETSPQSAVDYPKPEATTSAIVALTGFFGALWILVVLLAVVYAIMCFLVPIFIYRIMRRTTQIFELMQRQEPLRPTPTANNESAFVR